jgi:hypothetical protein
LFNLWLPLQGQIGNRMQRQAHEKRAYAIASAFMGGLRVSCCLFRGH